jgi:DNA-binding transcriptional LysR family regulator
MLDLHTLNIFATVVDEGSFSAAAERLLITQPAVSQQMSELEAMLHTDLFIRGRRGVQLTSAGHVLHRYAQRLLTLSAEAETALTGLSPATEGALTLGATPGASVYLLPEIIQEFRLQYPAATIQLQTGVTSFILEELRAQRIELGLVEGELELAEVDRFAVTPLAEVEQYVIVGSSHPWYTLPAIDMSALASQTFIMRPRGSHTRIWLDRLLVNHGLRPNVSAEFDNVESIKRAVAAGQCVTVLPEYVVSQEEMIGTLRRIPIRGRPLLRTLKLLRDANLARSALSEAFERMLTEVRWLPQRYGPKIPIT